MRKWSIKIVLVYAIAATSCSRPGNEVVFNDMLPSVFPDYCNVTIPAGIAPLNFMVKDCVKSEVIIRGRTGSIRIRSGKQVRIPQGKWRRMLEDNNGEDLTVTVTALTNKKWTRYRSFKISVKSDPVDPYIVYRLIAPGYEAYSSMGMNAV